MIESRSKGGGRLAALLFAGGRRRQLISIGLGLGALAAAIVALAWNRETLVDSVASLRSASPWTVLALLGGCAAQLLLSGLVFWWLYRRLVPVPVVEMSALIAATNAANFLPLRPGLVGRIAYLRARRAVPLSVSVRVTVEAAGLSAGVVSFVVLFAPLAERSGLPASAAFLACGLSAFFATISTAFRPYAIAALGRLGELGLLTWRYLLAFALIGCEIDVDAALAFACIASAASMVPLVPNGMGLREWAIGLLAPAVAGHSLGEGIAAELVVRAAELAVTVPAGALAAAWLARRPVAFSP